MFAVDSETLKEYCAVYVNLYEKKMGSMKG